MHVVALKCDGPIDNLLECIAVMTGQYELCRLVSWIMFLMHIHVITAAASTDQLELQCGLDVEPELVINFLLLFIPSPLLYCSFLETHDASQLRRNASSVFFTLNRLDSKSSTSWSTFSDPLHTCCNLNLTPDQQYLISLYRSFVLFCFFLWSARWVPSNWVLYHFHYVFLK